MYRFYITVWPNQLELLNTMTASLQRVKLPQRVSWTNYDIKQSDGEASVMLEIWGTQSTPLLPSLPGSFWLGVVASDRVLYMGQIELNSVLTLKGIV